MLFADPSQPERRCPMSGTNRVRVYPTDRPLAPGESLRPATDEGLGSFALIVRKVTIFADETGEITLEVPVEETVDLAMMAGYLGISCRDVHHEMLGGAFTVLQPVPLGEGRAGARALDFVLRVVVGLCYGAHALHLPLRGLVTSSVES